MSSARNPWPNPPQPAAPPPAPPDPTPVEPANEPDLTPEEEYDDTLEDSFPASDPPPGVIKLGPPPLRHHPS